MFSGIVASGIVEKLERKEKDMCLFLKLETEEPKIGDSIAVNGVCLTVANKKEGLLVFDVMQETLEKSNFFTLFDDRYLDAAAEVIAMALGAALTREQEIRLLEQR